VAGEEALPVGEFGGETAAEVGGVQAGDGGEGVEVGHGALQVSALALAVLDVLPHSKDTSVDRRTEIAGSLALHAADHRAGRWRRDQGGLAARDLHLERASRSGVDSVLQGVIQL